MKKLLLLALVAGLFATPAFAKGNKGAKADKTPEGQFAKLDANSDGKVTLDEYKASPEAVKLAAKKPEAVEKAFKKIDADGDGNVTLAEFKSDLEAKAAKKAAKAKK